jgi:hypothetical protein
VTHAARHVHSRLELLPHGFVGSDKSRHTRWLIWKTGFQAVNGDKALGLSYLSARIFHQYEVGFKTIISITISGSGNERDAPSISLIGGPIES